MSFTITISLCPSSKIAPLTISRTFCWYPFVKNSIALAYRDGVASRPSRSASSPTHSRIVRTASHILASLLSACSLVSSRRSRVPRLGRERPSKSITGLGLRVTVPVVVWPLVTVGFVETIVAVVSGMVGSVGAEAAALEEDLLDFFLGLGAGISRGSRAGADRLSRRSRPLLSLLWCLRFLEERSSPE